jgi:4-hydroxybenzoate polyprenyltransferase
VPETTPPVRSTDWKRGQNPLFQGTEAKEIIFTWLQLMRVPNIFTAVADVLAGYLIVSLPGVEWLNLLCLAFSSACIYAGGCVLNDYCDRRIDAVERPFRPIPSGRVSPKGAFSLACILFGLGITTSFLAGWTPFFIALLLTGLCISYDSIAKNLPLWGPLNMGACRALNLILGMSLALSLSLYTVIFPLVSLVHIFSLTVLSRFEVYGKPGSKRWGVLVGWGSVVLVLLALGLRNHLNAGSYLFLALYVLFTGPALLRAIRLPLPEKVGKAVRNLVLGTAILDCVYVSGAQSTVYALPVLACLFLSLYLARRFYVT